MFHALFPQAVDNVGRHARIDRGLDGRGVALLDEHRDRTFDDAAHLEHLLQDVAAGILEVDENDVGIERHQPGQQIRALGDPRDIAVAGLEQPFFEDGGPKRVLVDDSNLESRPHWAMLEPMLQRSKQK